MTAKKSDPKQNPLSPEEAIAHILAEIKAQHQAWTKFLTGLNPEQATKPVDGPWSAIDTLIHTTAWTENGLKVARLQAQPEEPDPGPHRGPAGYLHINVDLFNAKVFEAHRGWTSDQALEWNERVISELIIALTNLPPQRVLEGAGRFGARMWYWRPAFIHSDGHRKRVMRLMHNEFY